jgi:hypothetical protein
LQGLWHANPNQVGTTATYNIIAAAILLTLLLLLLLLLAWACCWYLAPHWPHLVCLSNIG